jgi:hypothetical protein
MKKKWIWPALIIILLVGAAGLFLLGRWGLSQIPSVEEQLPPGSNPIRIRLMHPENQSGWPLNHPIPIQIYLESVEPVKTVELYVNSTLYGLYSLTEAQAGNTQHLMPWLWQPGTTGKFILVARAVDASGGTGISNAVLVEAGDAIATGSPLLVEDEQSWEEIALRVNLQVEVIHQANPTLDPQEPLPTGSQILIPNPPLPLSNPNIIPGYDPANEPPEFTSDPPAIPEGDPASMPQWGLINDVQFFLKKLFQKDPAKESTDNPVSIQPTSTQPADTPVTPSADSGKLPPAPKIFGKIFDDDCTVLVYPQHFLDPVEEGYFIYRSRDGGEFERIATLPPWTDGSLNGSLNVYDKDQYGLVTYYASTFNLYGESAGEPISFPLDNLNCAGGVPQGNVPIIDQNGDLQLPYNLDAAYVYVQINDSQAVRVPEGDRMFLPGSGEKFNLDRFLNGLVDNLDTPDLRVHMEVWGWQGGKLVYAGQLDRNVYRTLLQVCSVEGQGGCTNGGSGEWVGAMTILPNSILPLNQQKYELRWRSTTLSETSQVCLAISEGDFTGPGFSDRRLTVLHVCYYPKSLLGAYVNENEGIFLLDFSEVLYPEGPTKYPPYQGQGKNYQYQYFKQEWPMGDPFSLAIRVLTIMDESVYTGVSNTVYMGHLSSHTEQTLPPLASQLPSLYDIEILEQTYQPQTYEIRSKWACVIIDEDPTGWFSPGQEVCPLTYVSCGVNMKCNDPGFWGMLAAGWDLVVGAINDAKEFIANAIIETIPYCEGSDACRDVVNSAVDYAVTYTTGLPPNLPDSDEAIAEAVTMMVMEELAYLSDVETAEFICGEGCQSEIKAQIKSRMENAQYFYSQTGCYDLAGHYGYFPICFQPPTIVHPVPGSGTFPGFVMVRVTRKNTPESLAAGQEIQGQIRLQVTVDGKNDTRIGQYRNNCVYTENVYQMPDPQNENSSANKNYYRFPSEPLEGPLYELVQVDIPFLQPGQSVDIPVKLAPLKNASPRGCIKYTDSQYLFYRGVSMMFATEYCFSPGSSQPWVPCTGGGTDTWSFTNPPGP